MLLGWNLCIAGDEASFNRIRGDRMRAAAQASHANKMQSPTAPVTAQPDLTQQTLDDVKAGIPARDAEIEAMRKQIETLQAQLQSPVNVHSNMCRGIIAPITFDMLAHVLGDDAKQEWIAAQAQPLDIRPLEITDGMALAFHHAITDGSIGQQDVDEIKIGLRAAFINVVDSLSRHDQAQQPVSGADQFRDAAQMIEPSRNSGELDELKAFEIELRRQCFQQPTHEARDLAWCMWQARAALAQQDTDKVDAERWRTFIDNYDEYGTVGFIDGSALKTVIDAARKEPDQ
jgi:hypothetical protein